MSRDWTPRETLCVDRKLEAEGKMPLHDSKISVWLNTDEEKQYLSDLAGRVDKLFRDFDPYGYMDDVEDEEENVKKIEKDIYSCDETLDGMIETVQEIAQDDELKEEALKIAEELKAVIKHHRAWNDKAREEFPNLSFLLGGFETGIYNELKDDTARKKTYERAEMILKVIAYRNESEEIDDEMIAERLECLSEMSYKNMFFIKPSLVTAVRNWYNPNPNEFYYNGENNKALVEKLDSIAEEMENAVSKSKTTKRNKGAER